MKRTKNPYEEEKIKGGRRMRRSLKVFLIILVVVVVLAAAAFGVWWWWTHKDAKTTSAPAPQVPGNTAPVYTADGDLAGFDRPQVYESDLTWRQFHNATSDLMVRLAECKILKSAEALYDGTYGIDQDLLLKMLKAGGFTRDQLTQLSDRLLEALENVDLSEQTSRANGSEGDDLIKFIGLVVMFGDIDAFSEALECVEAEQIQAAARVFGEAQLDNVSVYWLNRDGDRIWTQENASREGDVFANLTSEEREEYDFLVEGTSYSRDNVYFDMFDSDAAYIVLKSLKEMVQGFAEVDSATRDEAIKFVTEMFAAMITGSLDSFFGDDGDRDFEEFASGANALGEMLKAGVENISERLSFDLAYKCLRDCEIAFGSRTEGYEFQPLYYGWSEVQQFVADCLCDLTPEFLTDFKTDRQNLGEASEAEHDAAYGTLIARVGAFVKPHFDNMRADAKEALCNWCEMHFSIRVSVAELDSLFTHCADISIDEMTDDDKESIADEYYDFEPIERGNISYRFDADFPDVIALPADISNEDLRMRMLMYHYTFNDQAGVQEDRTKQLKFELDSNEYGFATLYVSYSGYTLAQDVYLYDDVEDNGEMIFDNQRSTIYGFTFEATNAPTEQMVLNKVLNNNPIKMRTRDSWKEISLDNYDLSNNVEFSVGDYDPHQAPGSYLGYVYAETWAGTWVIPFCYHIANPTGRQLCGFEARIGDRYKPNEAIIVTNAVGIYDFGLYKTEISGVTVSGDWSSVGTHTVTLTYHGYTITKEIEVYDDTSTFSLNDDASEESDDGN